MPKISIIVPIYNTKKDLPRSIESVLNQRYADFELILVDDGSTDGSGVICDAYAEKDDRLYVFHKANGGVSSARNLGLKFAKGEWICFLDSDDILFEDGLELLAAGISDSVDMVWGGYEIYNESSERTYAVTERVKYDLTNEEGIEMLFQPRHYRYLGFACTKLFRSTVITLSRICFDEDIYYNEDRLFCARFLCASKKGIHFFTSPVYGYYERDGSAMGIINKSFHPKFFTDLTAMIRMRDVINALYQKDKRILEMVESACYSSWRRMVGMKGFSDISFLTRTRVVIKLIEGLGLRRFFKFDWARNRNRIKKFIKRFF